MSIGSVLRRFPGGIEMKPFSSSFALNIAGLIKKKQADGLRYAGNAECLAVFDTFCVKNGYNDGILTRKIIDHWSEQGKTEI